MVPPEQAFLDRNLIGLEERFSIERPIFQYQDLQFDLEYVVNDILGDTFVDYKVFDGHDWDVMLF